MQHDIDQFGRDLAERLKWLLAEVKRLGKENERLLRENEELREEVTLARLHGELGDGTDLPDELAAEAETAPPLSHEALQFYRVLPEKINISEFFQYAEVADISGAQAREFMLVFFRRGLFDQRGRHIEKAASPWRYIDREVNDA